jgi:phenylacetate-CoA ligase
MLQFHPFIANNTSIYNTKVIKLSENILSFSWVDIVDENIDLFYKEMTNFQPEWLYGPPSAIFQFATLLKQRGFSAAKSLRYIELAGDYVLDHHRKLIDAFFKIPTGNMYGAREVNTIAYECPQRHLHVVPQSTFLEILDDDNNPVKAGESGNIVVTGLVNRVMPFIRYKLGDSGYLLNENCCGCGNPNPIVVLTSGRITDIINLPKRQPISAVIFWYAMQHINFNYGNPIIQFQVRQIDIDKFTLLLVVENNENHDAIINYFYNFIADYDLINSIKWTVEFVKYIYPNEKTGKLSYFINEMKLPERVEYNA